MYALVCAEISRFYILRGSACTPWPIVCRVTADVASRPGDVVIGLRWWLNRSPTRMIVRIADDLTPSRRVVFASFGTGEWRTTGFYGPLNGSGGDYYPRYNNKQSVLFPPPSCTVFVWTTRCFVEETRPPAYHHLHRYQRCRDRRCRNAPAPADRYVRISNARSELHYRMAKRVRVMCRLLLLQGRRPNVLHVYIYIIYVHVYACI